MEAVIEFIRNAGQVLIGLAIIIPLAWKMIEYSKKAVKERNWRVLLKMVIDLMQTAEDQFVNGASRKNWVLSIVKASADKIDFDIDMDEVGELIDSLCAMTKIVNPPTKKEKVG